VSDSKPVSAELSRDLNLFHVTMMGLGMMIGAGVFIGIGISTHHAGPGGVVLTFALSGLIALFTAMSFAELSSAIPRAGGAYNFARIAFGRAPSFLAGWMEWFASSVAGSLYAVVFASYTLSYLDGVLKLGLDESGMFVAMRVVAVAIASLFLYVNYRGASETGKIGALFTVGQMLFVLSIAGIGIVAAAVDPQRMRNFQPFLPNGWGVLLVTMGFIYVAFEGFEVIAQAGDEVIEPRKNIPKAMLYSVLIVTVTYVAVSFATMVAVKEVPTGSSAKAVWEWIGSQGPAGNPGEHGFREAVNRLVPYGGLVVTLAVIFSSTSALNATVYSATRASYALGRDRMLPARFAKISRKRRTPYVALAMTGVIVLTVAGFLPTRDVASCASMMFLFLFFLVNVCAIKIRRNMGDELQYGYLMPLFPVFPVLAIILQALLAANIIHMSVLAWVIAPAWILAGVGIYFLYSRSHAATTEDEILIFQEQRARQEGAGYRIMVSVANPTNALELVRNTYRLCGAVSRTQKPSVQLLHMVPVPSQVPLADAGKYMLEGKEAVLETMLYVGAQYPTSTHIRYCRNVARGIVSAVREKHVDLLIMGWHGGRRYRRDPFRIGSTVDPVLERVPCNVVILKDCGGERKFARVLVPLAGGPNGAYALEVASILAEPEQGQVTALTVRTGKTTVNVEAFVDAQIPRLHLPRENIHTRTVNSRNVADAILAEAQEHDLVVIGCSLEPRLRQVARDPLPQVIAQRCDKPMAMVKVSGGMRSWIKRWI